MLVGSSWDLRVSTGVSRVSDNESERAVHGFSSKKGLSLSFFHELRKQDIGSETQWERKAR